MLFFFVFYLPFLFLDLHLSLLTDFFCDWLRLPAFLTALFTSGMQIYFWLLTGETILYRSSLEVTPKTLLFPSLLLFGFYYLRVFVPYLFLFLFRSVYFPLTKLLSEFFLRFLFFILLVKRGNLGFLELKESTFVDSSIRDSLLWVFKIWFLRVFLLEIYFF